MQASAVTSLREDAALAQLVEQMADELREQGTVDVAAWQARYPAFASEFVRLAPTLGLLADFSSRGGDASSVEDPPDSFHGKTLGDFRLLRELGRGGMGIVFEAEQLSLNRRVALKILPTAAVLDPRTLQRFKNEAQAAAALDHPHIVDVYGIGAERGVHYFAMRLIDGCTLASVIGELRIVAGLAGQESAAPKVQSPRSQAEGQVDTRAMAGLSTFTTQESLRSTRFFRSLAQLGIHVAEGLDHAHRQGVIHRDIKPSNLMLDSQGKVWITDFGLAHIEANQSLTITGDLLGTLRYMSPEQALASRVAIDHRTDIYSLGATLYELVALQPVFGESDRPTLIHRIAFSEPVPPRRINARIPADLETILLKMLEKDPASRYASARDLADDLLRFIENQPIQARRRSWSQHIAKWSARNRPLVAAVTGMVLALVAVVGGLLGWQARDAAARRATSESIATSALASAANYEQQGAWPQALTEIKRAETALTGQERAAPALNEQIQARCRAVEMVLRLDAIRLVAATSARGDFDFSSADRAYAEAFAEFGIDLAQLPQQAALARLPQSPLREQLADALTNWSIVRKRAATFKRPAWPELLALAAKADPDPWRNRLRRAFEPDGVPASVLAELVLTAPVAELPTSTLFLLVQAAANQRVPGSEVQAKLREAQWRHPDDFWINFALAQFFELSDPPEWNEAVRYYSVALGVRPRTAAAHGNLGAALHRQGRRAEAMVEYRRAIEAEPGYAAAYSNLGFALCEEGRYREAEVILRQALTRRNDLAQIHTNLATALAGQNELDQAIAAYRRALEINPDFHLARHGLKEALLQLRQHADTPEPQP